MKRDVTDLLAEPGGAARLVAAAEAAPAVSAEQEAQELTRQSQAQALEKNAPYVGDLFPSALATMQARADGSAMPIPLPWRGVAEGLGGGLWPGLHVLTGGTGEGKSQWALQVALAAATAGAPVLYINLELGPVDMMARLASLMLASNGQGRGPKWSELYLGKDKIGLERARALADKVAGLPLRLEVGPPHGWHAELLRDRVAALRAEHPEPSPGGRPLLVVVDYLQALSSPPPAQGSRTLDLRERIGQASYVARAAARDFRAAVLLLSSVSRDSARNLGEWRREGELGDASKLHPGELVGQGKESGEIEYAADSVLALCGGEWDDVRKEKTVHLALAKVRAGAPSWCSLTFNGGWFSERHTSTVGGFEA